MASTAAFRAPALDPYPERADPVSHWLDPVETALLRLPRGVGAWVDERRSWARMRTIRRLGPAMAAMTDAELAAKLPALHERLRREGPEGHAVVPAFALIRELSRRSLGLFHHDVQVLGALAMLAGRVIEMDTGEGKTVTAALAAAAAGLAGLPVHVVTVNDYLAERDAATLRPLFAALGLRVAHVTHAVQGDARRAAYCADIVYASNKEIAFDYLRDRLLLAGRGGRVSVRARPLAGGGTVARPVMRGLHFAIVDEADSVMIDEARTPLILSQESDLSAERRWAAEAHALAAGLERERDWRLLADERRIELTRNGRRRLQEAADEAQSDGSGGEWSGRIRREEAVRKALAATHLFHAGEHYLVRDGQVDIVDEYSGRIMADRSWSDGLHQLIQFKEGLEITPRKLTIARLTYQRFFRRYRRLSGMTGTALETKGEFWTVYRLRVTRIPPHRPSRMQRLPTRVAATRAEKYTWVAARAGALAGQGRPVLIGVRSVSAARDVSTALAEAGLLHRVLSAENDREEAEVLAEAGLAGRITVATNMAGRGVDIGLGEGVAARGGLHVILTERHDAGRIDRQLEGRAARRGEPGSTEAFLSLQDTLIETVPRHPLAPLAGAGHPFRCWAAIRLIRAAQRQAERLHFEARRDLLRHDMKLAEILSFSGKGE